MNRITVIIPFKNEGTEVERTVTELNRFCTGFSVIVINDASNDGFDYSALERMPNVNYYYNDISLGVASCRDLGASRASTPYLLFLDGHMHVEEDIINPVLCFLEKYPCTLACLQSRVWEGIPPVRRNGIPWMRGCKISLSVPTLWNWEWQTLKSEDRRRKVIYIQCVMGAAYAVSRDYYLQLHGLWGLQGWGCDEQLLSVKVWLSGGRCVLLKEVEIGHNYRNSFPYHLNNHTVLRNRLFLTKLFIPHRLNELIHYERSRGVNIDKVTEKLYEQGKYIERERMYLGSVFTNNWEIIERMNAL